MTIAAATAGAQTRPGFVGTWTMDPARSESAHQDVPIGSSTVAISATEAGMTIETTQNQTGGAAPFHEVLIFKLDGSETTTTGEAGATVTVKGHRSGAKLIVETTRNIQESTVTTVSVHTLSPNGRELTIDKTLTVQHGYMGQHGHEGVAAPTTGHGKDVFVRAPAQ